MSGELKMKFEMDKKHAMTGIFLIGVLVGLSAGVIAGGTIMYDSPSNAPTDSGDNGEEDEIETVDVSDISADGEPVMGDADAPVTMYLYEDFECPFCKRFEQGALPQIIDEYVESGDVKLVWKDFPLKRIHPWAEDGATAMECVYREGGDEAFWNVRETVFENQKSVSKQNVLDKIAGWAAEEGVSESDVRSCYQNSDARDEVQGDLAEGQKKGISGTPTVLINGKKMVGAQPFNLFQPEIEEELGN